MRERAWEVEPARGCGASAARFHRPAPTPPSPRSVANCDAQPSKSPRRPAVNTHESPRILPAEEATWLEPKTARERELTIKLIKTQKELHRVRRELTQRTELAEEQRRKTDDGKPDWTLALRYRLTAELRAELTRLEDGWAGDKKAAAAQIHTLQTQLEQAKTEREQMVTRLLKEVLELQRLYARSNAHGEMCVALLAPEVRAAERERRDHVGVLEQRLAENSALRATEVAKLKAEVGRLTAAVAGVSEDLEEERHRKKQQHATLSMEVQRLQAELDRVVTDLGLSQHKHAVDVAELRKARSTLEVEVRVPVAAVRRCRLLLLACACVRLWLVPRACRASCLLAPLSRAFGGWALSSYALARSHPSPTFSRLLAPSPTFLRSLLLRSSHAPRRT